jgi:hypothetical protein
MAANACAVIADCGVHSQPRRGQERQPPAKAVADGADLALNSGPCLQRAMSRVADIAHALINDEAPAKLARGFDVVGTEAESGWLKMPVG